MLPSVPSLTSTLATPRGGSKPLAAVDPSAAPAHLSLSIAPSNSRVASPVPHLQTTYAAKARSLHTGQASPPMANPYPGLSPHISASARRPKSPPTTRRIQRDAALAPTRAPDPPFAPPSL